METPTATQTRSVRYECLCIRCGDQFELPSEGAIAVCPRCAPALTSAAKLAVEKAAEWYRSVLCDYTRGYILVLPGPRVFAWFGARPTPCRPWEGGFLVPVGGGEVLHLSEWTELWRESGHVCDPIAASTPSPNQPKPQPVPESSEEAPKSFLRVLITSPEFLALLHSIAVTALLILSFFFNALTMAAFKPATPNPMDIAFCAFSTFSFMGLAIAMSLIRIVK